MKSKEKQIVVNNLYSGVNKKVKRKQKGSRAKKKQISELKKMNEEMKK